MGIEKAEDQVAFGADFFYRKGIPDPERQPLFFEEHEDAGKYPNIVQQLKDLGIDQTRLEKLCYQNVFNFMSRNWS
jgi:microsomal dipeptidase-like Zn-dependent dipeptidase